MTIPCAIQIRIGAVCQCFGDYYNAQWRFLSIVADGAAAHKFPSAAEAAAGRAHLRRRVSRVQAKTVPNPTQMTDRSIFQDFRAWMFDDALPFWADRGADRRFGGFVETLDFSGRDSGCDFKRTRVACRQTYVFSHARILGFQDADEFIERGAEYLARKAWRAGEGGFARRLTRKGDISDPTPDLYDNAFALFAFAWAHQATGDAAYRDWAVKTLDWIEKHMRHPGGAGFWHEVPPRGDRLQNPHMHLLEAALAAFEATGEDVFQDCARDIVGLFQAHFFNRQCGTLAEYFHDDWTRAAGDRGRIAEPGHQFEWAWILRNCERLFGVGAGEEIRALVRFSERFGLNPHTGAVMNCVRDDGTPLDQGSRTWPNTERLKAAIALFELDGDDPAPVITASGRVLLDRYLTPNAGIDFPKGGWIDAFDKNGAPVARDMPASTLYHVFLAFAECLRVEKQLTAAA
jgi:N-acylglucosamine 2-epimerase/mannose-6-phosphate isomerase